MCFSEDIIASSKQKNSARILSLQPILQRGDFYINGSGINTSSRDVQELIFQMTRYSYEQFRCLAPHDDLLTSLSFHVEIRVRGGEAPVKAPPKNSPAWLERQWIGESNQMQRRLPMGRRKYYQPSLS